MRLVEFHWAICIYSWSMYWLQGKATILMNGTWSHNLREFKSDSSVGTESIYFCLCWHFSIHWSSKHTRPLLLHRKWNSADDVFSYTNIFSNDAYVILITLSFLLLIDSSFWEHFFSQLFPPGVHLLFLMILTAFCFLFIFICPLSRLYFLLSTVSSS